MRRYNNPLDGLIEGYQIIDFQYRVVSVNAAAAAHGHSTPSAMLGRSLIDCFPGLAARPWFAELKHGLERRVARPRLDTVYFLDEVPGPFELSIEPTAEGVCVVSIDGRDRAREAAQLRAAQDRLRQSDRIEALGMLSLGIAHDVNNFMSVIAAHGERALDRSFDAQRDAVTSMMMAAQHASLLTRQLLHYGADRIPRVARVHHPLRVLRDIQSMLTTALGPGIALVLDLPAQLVALNIGVTELEQIVMNLVLNARDALVGGGTIRVSACEVELDPRHRLAVPGIAPGRYVAFAVSDNGVGMNADTSARILEPFYTTKESGHGTGLGLSMVCEIVKRSGGQIVVDSALGHGSTFRVHLPCAEPRNALDGIGTETLGAPYIAQGKTVLVAEDDHVLRAIAKQTLSQAGYNVLMAGGGDEALRMCKRNPEISLLVTDVVMPGFDGLQLIDAVRLARPDVAVLCTTGFGPEDLKHQGIPAQVPVLEKPYPQSSLVRAVGELLRPRIVS